MYHLCHCFLDSEWYTSGDLTDRGTVAGIDLVFDTDYFSLLMVFYSEHLVMLLGAVQQLLGLFCGHSPGDPQSRSEPFLRLLTRKSLHGGYGGAWIGLIN